MNLQLQTPHATDWFFELPFSSPLMQFLRVVTNQLYDENARVIEVPWREAGMLKITDTGERLLSIHALPNITFRIIDERDKLPEIRY